MITIKLPITIKTANTERNIVLTVQTVEPLFDEESSKEADEFSNIECSSGSLSNMKNSSDLDWILSIVKYSVKLDMVSSCDRNGSSREMSVLTRNELFSAESGFNN